MVGHVNANVHAASIYTYTRGTHGARSSLMKSTCLVYDIINTTISKWSQNNKQYDSRSHKLVYHALCV